MKKEDKKDNKKSILKNKVFIITGGVIVLALIIFLVWWLLLRKVEVTLYYNNDKTEVIFVRINKQLQESDIDSKELGEDFIGWYEVKEEKENEKILDEKTFDFKKKITKKMSLYAVYSIENSIIVKFESNGGTEVADIVLGVDEELKLPENPTKEGYTFSCWKDKNEVPIGDGALLAEDIVLYAYWDKVEETKPVETPKPTETPKPVETPKTTETPKPADNSKPTETPKPAEETKPVEEPKPVTYKCEDGYTLDGTKCIKTANSTTVCPEGTFNYGRSQCVTIKYNVRKDSNKVCATKTIILGGGHTEEVQGKLVKYGTSYCYYKEVPTVDERNESTCTTRGHKWSNAEKKCYYDIDQNYTSSCDTGYALIDNPNSYQGVNGLNSGCYPVSNRAIKCPDGYNYTVYQNKRVCKMEKDATIVK